MKFRSAYEDYKTFFENLKKIHEERFVRLKEYIEKTLDKIEDDNVLLVMKDNPELDHFTTERITEILTNSITTEKEIQIHHLMEELAMTRKDNKAANTEIQRLAKSLFELKQKGNELVNQLLLQDKIISQQQKEIEELHMKLNDLIQVNEGIENTLKVKDQEHKNNIKEYKSQLKEWIEKYERLRIEYENSFNRLEGIKLEKTALDKQYKQTIVKLEMENNELKLKLKEDSTNGLLSETVKLHKEQLRLNEERISQEVKARQVIEERYKEQAKRLKELFDTETTQYMNMINELQEKKRKDKEEYEKIKDKLEDYEAKHKEVNKKLTVKENEIISLKMQLAAKITEIEEITFKVKNAHSKRLDRITPQVHNQALIRKLHTDPFNEKSEQKVYEQHGATLKDYTNTYLHRKLMKIRREDMSEGRYNTAKSTEQIYKTLSTHYKTS